MDEPYSVSRQEAPGNVYYTIRWSKLVKADLHEIRTSVPARSGIYEFYYMNEGGQLILMDIGSAFYGGVRSKLRAAADPELETNRGKKSILETYDCYYRYALAESPDDMKDILHFLTHRYFPGYQPEHHSGRYEKIFVKDSSPDKITDIREDECDE